jgi:hypothetical protein
MRWCEAELYSPQLLDISVVQPAVQSSTPSCEVTSERTACMCMIVALVCTMSSYVAGGGAVNIFIVLQVVLLCQ